MRAHFRPLAGLVLVALLVILSACQRADEQQRAENTPPPVAAKRGPILGGTLHDWRGPLAADASLKETATRHILAMIPFVDQKGDEYVLQVADTGSGVIVITCAIFEVAPHGLRLLYEAKETASFSKYIGVTWNEQGDEVTVRGEMGGRPQTLVLRIH